jgi:hypothetical protein
MRRWLLDLLTRRQRARAYRLDHAHQLPNGDRRRLADLDAIRREWL